MATRHWLGKALAVAQETRATPANVEITDIFDLIVNGVTVVSFTATAATVANVTAGLAAAWQASAHAYCTGITASDETTYLKLLADSAGMPFTVTSDTTDGGGTDDQTLTMSTPTANSGPNCWDVALNWSTGVKPAAADDVTIADSDVNICWGLDQNAIDLASLTIKRSYTGRIGLDRSQVATAADGTTTDTSGTPEYREDYLRIGWTTANIGQQEAPGTPASFTRLKLDNTKAGASTTIVHSVPTAAAETELPTVRLLFAHASANVYVRSASGGLGIAVDEPNETSTVGVVFVSDTTTATSVILGDGVTITTWKQWGGINTLRAAATVTTATTLGGMLTINGTMLVTTVNLGQMTSDDPPVSQGAGTINLLNVPAAGSAVATLNHHVGTIYALQSGQSRTWDKVNTRDKKNIKYDENVVTITTLNEI